MKKTNADTTHVCAHVDPAQDRAQICDGCKHPLSPRRMKATVLRAYRRPTGNLNPRLSVLLRKSIRANRTQFSLLA